MFILSTSQRHMHNYELTANNQDRNISTIPAEENKIKFFDSIQLKRPTNIFPVPTSPPKSNHAVESSGTVSIWKK